MLRRLIVVLAAFGALAGGARAHVIVGLSDQNAATFSQTGSLWTTFAGNVHLHAARLLFPWNLDTQSCFGSSTCPEDQWLAAVLRAGLTPYMVLQGQNSGVAPPSPPVYKRNFYKLLLHFEADAVRDTGSNRRRVVLWQSWNEPNEPANGTQTKPKLAADYWREANEVLTSYCKPKRHMHGLSGCVVVAGEFGNATRCDFSSGPNDPNIQCAQPGYFYSYAHELLRQTFCTLTFRLCKGLLPAPVYPSVWAFHAYNDLVNGYQTMTFPSTLKECQALPATGSAGKATGYADQEADCFVGYFAGTQRNHWDKGVYWHHPHIWLDEEGPVLSNNAGLTPLAANYTGQADNPNYPNPLGTTDAMQRQVAAAQEFTGFETRWGDLVQRLFYFDWGPGKVRGSNFDSALLDATGAPRVAYCVLTREPLSQCPGSLSALM